MNCKKCNTPLEERKHYVLKDKLLSQPFFYLRWYVCPKCSWCYMPEEEKIYNKTSRYEKSLRKH